MRLRFDYSDDIVRSSIAGFVPITDTFFPCLIRNNRIDCVIHSVLVDSVRFCSERDGRVRPIDRNSEHLVRVLVAVDVFHQQNVEDLVYAVINPFLSFLWRKIEVRLETFTNDR